MYLLQLTVGKLFTGYFFFIIFHSLVLSTYKKQHTNILWYHLDTIMILNLESGLALNVTYTKNHIVIELYDNIKDTGI